MPKITFLAGLFFLNAGRKRDELLSRFQTRSRFSTKTALCPISIDRPKALLIFPWKIKTWKRHQLFLLKKRRSFPFCWLKKKTRFWKNHQRWFFQRNSIFALAQSKIPALNLKRVASCPSLKRYSLTMFAHAICKRGANRLGGKSLG